MDGAEGLSDAGAALGVSTAATEAAEPDAATAATTLEPTESEAAPARRWERARWHAPMRATVSTTAETVAHDDGELSSSRERIGCKCLPA